VFSKDKEEGPTEGNKTSPGVPREGDMNFFVVGIPEDKTGGDPTQPSG